MILDAKKYIHHDQMQMDLAFQSAVNKGDLEAVKFFCHSPLLHKRANISAMNFEAFRLACRNNQLEIVKFLTNNALHANPIDLNHKMNLGLAYAIEKNNVDILAHLLSNKDLVKTKKQAQITLESAKGYMNNLFRVSSMYDDRPIEKRIALYELLHEMDNVKEYLKDDYNRQNFHQRLISELASYYIREDDQEAAQRVSAMVTSLVGFLVFAPVINISKKLIEKIIEEQGKSQFYKNGPALWKTLLEAIKSRDEKKLLLGLLPVKPTISLGNTKISSKYKV